MRKENITPSDMIRGQNLFLARNLFISRSMAVRFPHGALKLQPRDEKDISHWSVKIVSGSKNRFYPNITFITEPSMKVRSLTLFSLEGTMSLNAILR